MSTPTRCSAAERAREYIAIGSAARVEFDPAGPYTVYDGRQLSLAELDRSERFCKLLRDAVGGEADLLFGAHGQMTAAGASGSAKPLAKYDPLWLEEPIPPDNQKRWPRWRTALPSRWRPASGSPPSGSLRVLEEGAAAICRMDLRACRRRHPGRRKNPSMAEALPRTKCAAPVLRAMALGAARCAAQGHLQPEP